MVNLRKILEGRNQIYVSLYRQGEREWFFGGFFYVDGRAMPLDGGKYDLDMPIRDYTWRDSTSLKVVVSE